jgi:hypothetical protein
VKSLPTFSTFHLFLQSWSSMDVEIAPLEVELDVAVLAGIYFLSH